MALPLLAAVGRVAASAATKIGTSQTAAKLASSSTVRTAARTAVFLQGTQGKAYSPDPTMQQWQHTTTVGKAPEHNGAAYGIRGAVNPNFGLNLNMGMRGTTRATPVEMPTGSLSSSQINSINKRMPGRTPQPKQGQFDFHFQDPTDPQLRLF